MRDNPDFPPQKNIHNSPPMTPELGRTRQKRTGGAYIPSLWPIYPVVGGIVPNPARVIPPESAPTRERYINHSKVQSPKNAGQNARHFERMLTSTMVLMVVSGTIGIIEAERASDEMASVGLTITDMDLEDEAFVAGMGRTGSLGKSTLVHAPSHAAATPHTVIG